MNGKHTPGRLIYDEHEKCECCTQLWDESGNMQIAEATCGDWGDEYPVLKHVGSGSLDQSYQAVMERIPYGHIEPATAKANAARLVACWNACLSLSDPERQVGEMVELLREAVADGDLSGWMKQALRLLAELEREG